MVLWINNRIEVENQMIKMKILDKKEYKLLRKKYSNYNKLNQEH